MDEVSSLHSQASKDKEVVEEDYQKALEVIFAYGYGCFVSNTTSVETNQRFQMVCVIPPTHCRMSSL